MLAFLRILNDYVGIIALFCLAALWGIGSGIGHIGKVLAAFYEDYRRVNRLSEREKFERENPLG
jgi:hypothetical protein